MKRTFGFVVLGLALAALILPLEVFAQDLHPTRRPSPMGMARINVDDTYVSVVYSRPYKRGRDNIFGTEESGALVPYGQIWRTGANEATQFTTTSNLIFPGDQVLPEGTYSLFTTPGPKEWTIHFNSRLGLNGTFYRNPSTGQFEPGVDPELNVVNVTVPVSQIHETKDSAAHGHHGEEGEHAMPAHGDGEAEEVEQLTISLEEAADEHDVHMFLRWINTEIKVPFKVAD